MENVKIKALVTQIREILLSFGTSLHYARKCNNLNIMHNNFPEKSVEVNAY
jgi:hypothetical protein